MKAAHLRPRADADIDDCFVYIAKDNPGAASRFLDALERSFALIAEQPGIGSPRYAHLPALSGLRMWVVPDLESYLIFYIEKAQFVDVVRILHAARDIPSVLWED